MTATTLTEAHRTNWWITRTLSGPALYAWFDRADPPGWWLYAQGRWRTSNFGERDVTGLNFEQASSDDIVEVLCA